MGSSYTLGGGVVDMWGNVRSDPITWSAGSAGITVSSAGVVTAPTIGRYIVRATSSLGTGNALVSVVPRGRLAAWSSPYGSGNIFAVDLDGTNRVTLASLNDGGIGAHPAWIPGTSTIVYSAYVNGLQTLYKVGTDAMPAPFFATRPPNVSHEAEPTPSADGRWLYFSASDSRCTANAYCLYRSRIDGTEPELLGSYISTTRASWRPAPSSDGSKVAFVLGGPDVELAIRVFDVATKTVSSWSAQGEAPVWSPDGAQIAYVASGTGAITLINPDGSGARMLTPPGYAYTRPLSWSPDGRWIVAPSQGMLHLIDAVSGAVLPLEWSVGLYAGSLK
jgi:Tol biopolymer transport system component